MHRHNMQHLVGSMPSSLRRKRAASFGATDHFDSVAGRNARGIDRLIRSNQWQQLDFEV